MATVYKPGRKLPPETELPALWSWVHCSELWGEKKFFFFFCFYHPIYSIIFNRSLNRLRHRWVPGGSDGKASSCNAVDPGWIPGLGRFPGEGNGNSLQ